MKRGRAWNTNMYPCVVIRKDRDEVRGGVSFAIRECGDSDRWHPLVCSSLWTRRSKDREFQRDFNSNSHTYGERPILWVTSTRSVIYYLLARMSRERLDVNNMDQMLFNLRSAFNSSVSYFCREIETGMIGAHTPPNGKVAWYSNDDSPILHTCIFPLVPASMRQAGAQRCCISWWSLWICIAVYNQFLFSGTGKSALEWVVVEEKGEESFIMFTPIFGFGFHWQTHALKTRWRNDQPCCQRLTSWPSHIKNVRHLLIYYL